MLNLFYLFLVCVERKILIDFIRFTIHFLEELKNYSKRKKRKLKKLKKNEKSKKRRREKIKEKKRKKQIEDPLFLFDFLFLVKKKTN